MAATHVTPGWYFQAADESICTQGRTAVRAAGSCLCLCVSHFRSSAQPLFRFQSHLPLCIRLGSVAGGALPQGQASRLEKCLGRGRCPDVPGLKAELQSQEVATAW